LWLTPKNLFNKGIKKAAVFPEPVKLLAKTSFPEIIGGMDYY